MAITYHAGRRIQGLERVGSAITFEDDFTSYATQGDADTAYPTNDTADFRVNITNDYLYFDSKTDGTTNHGIYHDLGTALSNTAWVLDFKMVLQTVVGYNGSSAIAAACYFTMNDQSNGNAIGGSVDAIGFYLSTSTWNIVSTNASALNGGIVTPTSVSVGTTYVRLIRLTATSFVLKLYSDSARTVLISSTSLTNVSTSTVGLRYLRIQNNNYSGFTTGSGRQQGYITNIKIYDGVTSVVAISGDVKPTNVQVGSRFEETDTRKMYHYNPPPTVTFEDDFTSYADTTAGDVAYPTTDTAKMRVNPTNDNLDFNSVRDSSIDLIYKDLTSVSDTSWVLRFKIRFSAVTTYPIFWIGLSSNTSSDNVSQDGLFAHYTPFNATTTYRFGGVSCDAQLPNARTAVSLNGGQNHVPSISTDYYIEIARTSSTNYNVKIFSDSLYATQVGSTSGGTIAATITGLRYFKIFNYSQDTDAGALTGIIDDIEFYNGITTIPTGNTWSEEGT